MSSNTATPTTTLWGQSTTSKGMVIFIWAISFHWGEEPKILECELIFNKSRGFDIWGMAKLYCYLGHFFFLFQFPSYLPQFSFSFQGSMQTRVCVRMCVSCYYKMKSQVLSYSAILVAKTHYGYYSSFIFSIPSSTWNRIPFQKPHL